MSRPAGPAGREWPEECPDIHETRWLSDEWLEIRRRWAAHPRLVAAYADLLRDICELCRVINPQHATCQSCDDMEGYRAALAEAGEGE